MPRPQFLQFMPGGSILGGPGRAGLNGDGIPPPIMPAGMPPPLCARILNTLCSANKPVSIAEAHAPEPCVSSVCPRWPGVAAAQLSGWCCGGWWPCHSGGAPPIGGPPIGGPPIGGPPIEPVSEAHAPENGSSGVCPRWLGVAAARPSSEYNRPAIPPSAVTMGNRGASDSPLQN